MAIELDLLFIMEQMEKMYSSADDRWSSLKEIIREQQAAQQGVQPTDGILPDLQALSTLGALPTHKHYRVPPIIG